VPITTLVDSEIYPLMRLLFTSDFCANFCAIFVQLVSTTPTSLVNGRDGKI
jgi:hypothetical protein